LSDFLNDFKKYVTNKGRYTLLIEEGIAKIFLSEKNYYEKKIGSKELVNREYRDFEDYWLAITEEFIDKKMFNSSSINFLLKNETVSQLNGGIRFLFKQFLNKNYLDDNPKVKEFNSKIKIILKTPQFNQILRFSNIESITKSTISINNSINNFVNFDKMFEGDDKEVKIELAKEIYEIISNYTSIKYSDLMNNLRKSNFIEERIFVRDIDDERDIENINIKNNVGAYGIKYFFGSLKDFLEKATLILSIKYKEENDQYEDYNILVLWFLSPLYKEKRMEKILMLFLKSIKNVENENELKFDIDFDHEKNLIIKTAVKENIDNIKKRTREIKSNVIAQMQNNVEKSTIYNMFILMKSLYNEFILKNDFTVSNEICFINELNSKLLNGLENDE